jgi:hypothetical protein
MHTVRIQRGRALLWQFHGNKIWSNPQLEKPAIIPTRNNIFTFSQPLSGRFVWLVGTRKGVDELRAIERH